MIKKQFTLYLQNTPGVLANVAKVIAKAKVNIEGISVAETTEMSVAQLITSNAALTRKMLNKAKIPFTAQDVAVFVLDNKPGALAAVAATFAKHGININYLYATTYGESRSSVVVGADDVKRVEKSWEQDQSKTARS